LRGPGHAYSYTYCDSDGNSNGYRNTYSDSNGDCHHHCYGHADSDGNTHCTKTYSHAATSPNPAASPVGAFVVAGIDDPGCSLPGISPAKNPRLMQFPQIILDKVAVPD